MSDKVANYETDIVIDSGSRITVMSLDSLSLINKYAKTSLEISCNDMVAKTATGESLEVVGTTCVEVDLGKSVWYVHCYTLLNFKFSFLLGTDFLIKANASIDLGNLQVAIGQETIPVTVLGRPSEVQVCVVESLEIPARSEALLTGCVNGSQGTVLIEPKYEIASDNSSLYPARCIANVKNGEIPIKIANPNIFPVKIFSGTCVGMAETVEKESLQSKGGESTVKPSSTSWIDDVDITNCHISEQEKSQVIDLLTEYEDVFVTSTSDFGKGHRSTHNIKTGDNPPFRQRPYRIPQSQLDMVDEHIQGMLEKGIIQESISPWSQPLVTVTKKDGSPRFCIYFRKLNSITKKQIFPMPRIDEVLDSLGDACYFTTLDLASGYWQIPMSPDDIEKLLFVPDCLLFYCKVTITLLPNMETSNFLA